MLKQWTRNVCGLILAAVFVATASHAQDLAFPGPASGLPDGVQALIDKGQFHDAEQALRGYLKQNDHSAAAHELLAYALLRQNKPRESLEEYTRSAAIERPSAEMLERVGQDYVLLNDYADADAWTLRAVQMEPSYADGWYSLGRIRYTEQRFSDAQSCFQKSVSLSPKSVKAENNLGLTYEALNQTDAAIAAYRQAIAWQNDGPHEQRSEQPLLNLGIVLLHRSALAEAEPLLVEAAEIAPKDPGIRGQLGHLYMQKADYAAARRELEQACALDAKNSSLHYLLGQVYRRLGLQEEAKAEFATSERLVNASRP
ncbi:MAG TPA: tetratricopeptide repeat protein [Acidobacteriaceae bacterium]|nr:tetratricopeptide repeat protein [Acidobacteriaceae bacterium]